jgi:signal transduction histidine kinase
MNYREWIGNLVLSVPVRFKIAGIVVLPVLILGLGLTYWVQTGLSDWLSYLLTDERVLVAINAGRRSVYIITLIAVASSVVLTYLLMILLTRPLLELREVAHKVAEGDLSSRAKMWARDEIGDVTQAFNEMLDRLITGQQKLKRTNRRLEAINRVAMVTGRELDLREVLNVSLKTTLAVMGLKEGWISLREGIGPDDTSFRLASQLGIDRTLGKDLQEFPGGLCLCQRDLLAGNMSHHAAVRTCLRKWGSEENSKELSHITIPLAARGQQFGVINLLCPEGFSPSDDDLELLTTIGAHISEIVANAWLHADLVEKEMVRQALLAALVRAEEDERARLARELHDGTGQKLTSLLIRMKTIENFSADESLQSEIAQLCESISEAIESLRDVSYRLRPAALEEFGLEVAINSLANEMGEAAGISTECKLDIENKRLPFEVETTIYRIAQESITNVVRHAKANRVLVELKALPYAVCLKIDDDGIGFDPEDMDLNGDKHRLGLLSMRERAEMQGGSLEVHSTPGVGTSVQVRIPLKLEENYQPILRAIRKEP